jgi:hypothetical protein
MHFGLYVKYTFCHILMKIKFSGQIFEKYTKYQILHKFVLWDSSCSMRAVGQSDMKLINVIAFRNFANMPKNLLEILLLSALLQYKGARFCKRLKED